jgi:hypothetical protein
MYSSLVLNSGQSLDGILWLEKNKRRVTTASEAAGKDVEDAADHVTTLVQSIPSNMYALLSDAQDFRITCLIVCQKKTVYI